MPVLPCAIPAQVAPLETCSSPSTPRVPSESEDLLSECQSSRERIRIVVWYSEAPQKKPITWPGDTQRPTSLVSSDLSADKSVFEVLDFFVIRWENRPTTMPCSAVTLSLATITSIIAVALLAIAFATDNWLYIEVRRSDIQVSDFCFFCFVHHGQLDY